VSQDSGRLFCIEHGRLRERTPAGVPPGAKVSALSEDDQVMLFFVTGVGLVRLESGRAVPLHAGAPDMRYVTVIHHGGDGTLWLGGSHGLTRLRGGEYKVFTIAEGPFASRVRGISEEPDGLWLATASGLAWFQDGAVSRITTEQGLPENYLRLVLDDRLGHLWLASRSRVVRLDKSDVREVLAGRRAQVTPLLFDATDGWPLTEAPLGSNPGFRAADGRLWMATAKGAAVVDPARLPDAPAVPVRIESITVDGRTEARAEYAPGRGEVAIEYTALRFRAARKMRFRYRLEGLDPDWVDAGPRRSAYYSHLPPGRYTFVVQAAVPGGAWGVEPARLEFTLRPHFHQTPLFYALGGLALALGAAAAHRLRVAQVKARYDAVIAERTRIARELHDSLAQSLAGTKLQIEVAMGTLPDPVSRTRRHLQLARSMVAAGLTEVRRSIWVLRAQAVRGAEGLGSALRESLSRLTSDSGTRLTLDVAGEPRPLRPEVERNLLRVAHEAVTNALRHSGAENVSVTLHFTEDAVRLRVCDDGRGFDPETTRRGGEHFGLLGMAERARALGGELRVESGADAGTEIDCHLPYRPARRPADVEAGS
jgi:signal transduction histidine kinase